MPRDVVNSRSAHRVSYMDQDLESGYCSNVLSTGIKSQATFQASMCRIVLYCIVLYCIVLMGWSLLP
jgi:hypothetical protein